MTSLDNIVLKEHLKRSLPRKYDKLRCFERVLTDAHGKSTEEAYFLLVDEGIYFSDVKCSSIRLATSLRHVTDIAIVKTPRLGLAEEYRVQTLQVTCRVLPPGWDDEDDDEAVAAEEDDPGVAAADGDEAGQLSRGAARNNQLSAASEADAAASSGGCFGRGRRRRQQMAEPPTEPSPPPPPQPPPAPPAQAGGSDAPEKSSGGRGCLPRRRHQQQQAAEAASDGAAEAHHQNGQQQHQQPPLSANGEIGLNSGDSNPRPAVPAAQPAAPPSGEEPTVRSFRILCNVFSSSRSVAYLHLRNTWQMSTLLKSLEMDADYVEATTPRTPSGRHPQRRGRRAPKGLTSAHLTQLFRELRGDIVRTQGNMQEAFGYLFELKLSLDRGFPVKRLFWETDDLFRCVVNKLFYYLNKDPALLQGRVSSPAAIRLDELDYCLLSLQILSAVFLDTEFMVERRKTVSVQQHYFMQRMLRACAVRVRPCVPNFVYDPAKTRPDHRVTAQLHIERAALLHHLITYLRTGISAWSTNAGAPLIGRSDGSIVSESQVVELLDSEADGLHQMLTESVRYLCHELDQAQPASAAAATTAAAAADNNDGDDDDDEHLGASPPQPERQQWLKPQAAVHVYYLLFLANSVLSYSNSARDHLVRQHREDFRFFISEHRIRSSVRADLPIFAGLLELAKQVRGHLGIL